MAKEPNKELQDPPRWAGRVVAHVDHAAALDRDAALHEFKHGMSREDAENEAHRLYRVDQHRKAAAHHLRGMKAAQGSGDMDDSRKHGAMYELHLRELGHDPWDAVPDDIKREADSPEKDRHYKFRSHRGDTFVLAKSLLHKGKVLDIQPRIQARQEADKQQSRQKVEGIFGAAHDIMAEDPGFKAAGRQREAEGKAAKLRAGPANFRPGDKVHHVDTESYPWEGTVTQAGYREYDIDGPGHYYSVKWWNPRLNQFHDDYLHQDNLKR